MGRFYFYFFNQLLGFEVAKKNSIFTSWHATLNFTDQTKFLKFTDHIISKFAQRLNNGKKWGPKPFYELAMRVNI